MQYIYHVSETSGIKEFVPRKFWHINYQSSGPVYDGSDIPSNAEIITCVYASSEEYSPFYYAPQRCSRLYVSRRKNPEKFELAAQIFGHVTSDKVLVFDEQDHSSLESHIFFIYCFDAKDFQRLPNGEYVTHQTVIPVQETQHKNALKHLLEAGYQVEFVEDLHKTRQALSKLGLVVNAEGVRVKG